MLRVLLIITSWVSHSFISQATDCKAFFNNIIFHQSFFQKIVDRKPKKTKFFQTSHSYVTFITFNYELNDLPFYYNYKRQIGKAFHSNLVSLTALFSTRLLTEADRNKLCISFKLRVLPLTINKVTYSFISIGNDRFENLFQVIFLSFTDFVQTNFLQRICCVEQLLCWS